MYLMVHQHVKARTIIWCILQPLACKARTTSISSDEIPFTQKMVLYNTTSADVMLSIFQSRHMKEQNRMENQLRCVITGKTIRPTVCTRIQGKLRLIQETLSHSHPGQEHQGRWTNPVTNNHRPPKYKRQKGQDILQQGIKTNRLHCTVKMIFLNHRLQTPTVATKMLTTTAICNSCQKPQ